jgi:hypothetical protein
VSAPAKTVFVSHTSKNDPFVAALKPRLESRGYTVLENSRIVRRSRRISGLNRGPRGAVLVA